MMRFGRNSEERKAQHHKRKTQKCHIRFCGTVNNEGHSFRKGVPFKWSKLKPVCGISVVKREIAVVKTTAISIFGGLEGDRTLDLCDANAALSQLSYEPILAIFHRKSCEKRIFRIFDFEGIVRKIGLLIGKGPEPWDVRPYGCEPYALPAELWAHIKKYYADADYTADI
mgnify:CR=1 FL=1